MIVDGSLGPRVRWAFADRTTGASLPPYAAGNLADHVAVGVDLVHLVSMAPVHGNAVGHVDGPSEVPVPEVDALVTTVPGLALLVVAADCVPVLLADGEAGVVAVVHSGWRGVLADVTGTALRSMTGLGARHERVRAVVGPAICGSCYDVPRERFDEVSAVAPSAATVASGGRPGLDLRAAVVSRLRADGVTVTLHGGCTAESPDLYSFRRDPVTGRHGGVVMLLPEPRPAQV